MSQFPSPAREYELDDLSFDKYLKPNPPATFLRRMHKFDDSMIDIGLLPNCIVIIDNSLPHKPGYPALIAYNGKEIIKILRIKNRVLVELQSSNEEKNYPPITFNDGDQVEVLGMVTASVFKYK